MSMVTRIVLTLSVQKKCDSGFGLTSWFLGLLNPSVYNTIQYNMWSTFIASKHAYVESRKFD